MNRFRFPYWLLLIVFVYGLTACNLSRPKDSSGDIDPLIPPAAAAAQTNSAVIRLQPAESQVEAGTTTTSVEIRVDNVTNLFGIDIELRFNPTMLKVQDANPNQAGTQIQQGNYPVPDNVTINEVNDDTGVIRYIVNHTSSAPVSGGGVTAVVTFLGVNPGSSDVTFSIVKLANIDGQPIETTAQSGRVTVSQTGGEATATAIPQDTPTSVDPAPTVVTVTPVPTGTPATLPTTAPEATASQQQPPPDATVPPDVNCTPIPKGPTPDPHICGTPTVPTSVPIAGTLGFCYQVQYGETIYSLSETYGVSVHALNIVNDLWPRNMVYANMAVFIPTQLGNGPNFYIVENGDTLESLGKLCRLNPWLIAKTNGLGPDAVLEPGQVLEMPIPPFPPPAKFSYPTGPIPVLPPPGAPPPCCGPHPPIP